MNPAELFLAQFGLAALFGGVLVVALDRAFCWGLETMRYEADSRAFRRVYGPTAAEAQWIEWTNPEVQA